MPTAAEFDGWATELETLRDDLATINRVTPDHAPCTIMRGNENEQFVITAVEQITGNASSASIHLGALATLCRDRARACEWYTDLYQDWERGMARYIEVAATAEGFMGESSSAERSLFLLKTVSGSRAARETIFHRRPTSSTSSNSSVSTDR